MRAQILSLAGFLLSSPAFAEDPARVCPADPVPQAGNLSRWTDTPRGVSAGTTIVAMPILAVGVPVRLQLSAPEAVTPVVAPDKPLDPSRFSGLATLTVARAGRVGIVLSHAAWVDVVSAGKAQASVEHGHGPDCSGIRKIVWFDLQPGTHIIQILDSPAQEITAMVIRNA